MKYPLTVGLALAALASATSARAEPPPWRNQDRAIIIPPAAMQELLRCRHQQRPEDECFNRMVQTIDNSHRVAQGEAKSVL